jgi:phage gpG-like protein
VTSPLGGTFGGRAVIDSRKLADLLRSGPAQRRLTEVAYMIKEEAQRRVGVWRPSEGEPDWSVSRRVAARKPGTLRDSIVTRQTVDPVTGLPAVLVGSNDPIALIHHEGTKPHPIRARNKPLLVFWWAKKQRVVRTPAVRHPGTKPNRYLTDSLRTLRGRL